MVRRLARLVVVAIAACLGSGCELANNVIPRSDPFLVVHAVIDPSNRIQYVLVEESLTGAVTLINRVRYDPANPIADGNGVPVSGAIVTLIDPDGLVMTGKEELSNGRSTGVYDINLDTYKTNIQLGKRYALSVSARGAKVTGSTLVPAVPTPAAQPATRFNRDSQSLSITIKDTVAVRAYWIKVATPLGPYQLFSVDPHFSIEGQARNLFTDNLERVFYPGFLQTMTVAAIDSNLYDYYRSGNDPFSGTGLINHLTGGEGVFGAIAVADQRILDVTQNPVGDSIEGHYTLRSFGGAGAADKAFDLRLFVAAPGGGVNPDRISGSRLWGTATVSTRTGVLGTRVGNTLTLDLLNGQSTSQVDDTFRATIKGDTLFARFDRFTQPNPTVYVRFGR